jgi:hypothetical protein
MRYTLLNSIISKANGRILPHIHRTSGSCNSCADAILHGTVADEGLNMLTLSWICMERILQLKKQISLIM